MDGYLGSNFRIDFGCNLASFSDKLSLLDLEHEGWFLNVTGTC